MRCSLGPGGYIVRLSLWIEDVYVYGINMMIIAWVNQRTAYYESLSWMRCPGVPHGCIVSLSLWIKAVLFWGLKMMGMIWIYKCITNKNANAIYIDKRARKAASNGKRKKCE